MAFAAIAFFPGLAFGSFLNVVAARIPLRRSLVSPGSACMTCGTVRIPFLVLAGMSRTIWGERGRAAPGQLVGLFIIAA